MSTVVLLFAGDSARSVRGFGSTSRFRRLHENRCSRVKSLRDKVCWHGFGRRLAPSAWRAETKLASAQRGRMGPKVRKKTEGADKTNVVELLPNVVEVRPLAAPPRPSLNR